MSDTDSSRAKEKVVSAFKGCIRNHLVVPSGEPGAHSDPEYDSMFRAVIKDNQACDILYRIDDKDRVLDLVDRLYPAMTHGKVVERALNHAVKAWVEDEHAADDQQSLVQSAEQFLGQVEQRIQDQEIFIPLDGLNVTGVEGIKVARCLLFSNPPSSDLHKVFFSKYPNGNNWPMAHAVRNASAFFKVRVRGHFERATEKGRQEAELALNLLRLFIASYYYHEYRQVQPTRMGIYGLLPGPASSVVFAVPADTDLETCRVGFSEEGTASGPFELTAEWVDRMRSLGLDRINDHIAAIEEAGSSKLVGSLLRSVTWFGKATSANSVAESFLMYALALEGLLGDGDRGSKEQYAERVAALVTRETAPGLYPTGWGVSPEFARNYRGASTTSDRFNAVRERVIELYTIRNSIAHGSKLERDILGLDLLDFETLVRNSILSFVVNGWPDLGSFKDWIKRRVTLAFSPDR